MTYRIDCPIKSIFQSTTGWYADTPELTHVDVFIAASLEWLKRMDKNGDKFFDGFPLMEAHYKKVSTIFAITFISAVAHE